MVRRRLFAVLLTACVFAAGCANGEDPQPAEPATTQPDAPQTPAVEMDGPLIRVVAMNIEGAARATVEQIAERIAAHRPDVVLLCEVNDRQVDQFARLLDMHRAVTAGLPGRVGRVETAVLCRWPVGQVRLLSSPRRTFAVLATTTRPDEPPGPLGEPAGPRPSEPAGPRPGGEPAAAPPAPPPLRLISIHQQSTHPGPVRTMLATTRQRIEETSLLLEAVAELTGPIILGGDFNEGAESFSLKRLDERFDNAFSQAGRGSPVTFPGFAGGIRIDHIFHTRDFAAVECFVDPADLSDHRMVVATLRPTRGRKAVRR